MRTRSPSSLFRDEDFAVDTHYDAEGYTLTVRHLPSERTLTARESHTTPAWGRRQQLQRQIEDALRAELGFTETNLRSELYRADNPSGGPPGLLRVNHLPTGLSRERYASKDAENLTEMIDALVRTVWESGFRGEPSAPEG